MKLFSWALPGCAFILLFVLHLSGVDAAKLSQLDGSATYTDRHGTVLGTVLGGDSSHAIGVRLSSISPCFLDAIVAAEDARFWHHGAVDIAALLRAARDFAIFGEARSGGSTIEMQLARLLHPTPPTIGGKIEQIVDAQRIAMVSAKTAILEAYVNRAPMGGNIYGVEAAARTYFGEPASDLDLAQGALLAAIPNDPRRLAPGGDWAALRARQRFVLERLVRLGIITQPNADLAFNETLVVGRHDSGIAQAAHALFFLANQRYRGGRVRTTIDASLQRFVEAQTQDVVGALARFNVSDGAALVVDNRSGEVLAYVGSPDYFADAVLGRNDGIQALRQPGSSLKPFTYELALERGTISSTTILSDAPATYAIAGGQLYAPVDYSGRFSGPVRVRYALANSLNAPAVQVLSAVGVPPLLERLHALGFTHLTHPASYYGLGLTLGSGEVSLWELVQAYATVARDGEFVPLHLLPSNDASPRQIGRSQYWRLITDMLADVHARAKSFGVGSVLEMPFRAAVKTGTSSDFRDTWTVGYTRDYTVGTWVGNFDGSPMRGVSGVTGAGPLWNRIMLRLYERNADPPPFSAPSGFARTAICATTGHAPTRTCAGIVQEWVDRRKLGEVARVERAPALSIVFPHDGDAFTRNPTPSTLASREQQLPLRALYAGRRVEWYVGGRRIALDANGNAFWPLRLGTWRIDASDGLAHASVTIRVVPPQQNLRPGFTISARH